MRVQAAGGRGGAGADRRAGEQVDRRKSDPHRRKGVRRRRRDARDQRAVREPRRRRRSIHGDGRRRRQSARRRPRPPVSHRRRPRRQRPIVFRVVGDGRVLHVSKPVVRGDAPEPVSVDVRGIKTLVLQVKPVDGNRAVAANWADAKFIVSGAPHRSRSTFPSSRARCSRRSPDRRRASTVRRSPA